MHGAGGSSSIWFKQIKAYKQHFNLLLIDLRGHGKSNQLLKELIASRYTFTEVTQDILKVLDHLKIQSAHFVGMSLVLLLFETLLNCHQSAYVRWCSAVLSQGLTLVLRYW